MHMGILTLHISLAPPFAIDTPKPPAEGHIARPRGRSRAIGHYHQAGRHIKTSNISNFMMRRACPAGWSLVECSMNPPATEQRQRKVIMGRRP